MISGMIPNKNLLKDSITDLALIKKLIPHREPMIMVDALLYVDNLKAVSELTVINSNIFVENNTFSETGLIEHMAQTAALLTGYKYQSENLPIKEGFIAAIKSLNIERLPCTTDIISTAASIIYELAQMTMVQLTSSIEGQPIASAEMTLVLKDNA